MQYVYVCKMRIAVSTLLGSGAFYATHRLCYGLEFLIPKFMSKSKFSVWEGKAFEVGHEGGTPGE